MKTKTYIILLGCCTITHIGYANCYLASHTGNTGINVPYELSECQETGVTSLIAHDAYRTDTQYYVIGCKTCPTGYETYHESSQDITLPEDTVIGGPTLECQLCKKTGDSEEICGQYTGMCVTRKCTSKINGTCNYAYSNARCAPGWYLVVPLNTFTNLPITQKANLAQDKDPGGNNTYSTYSKTWCGKCSVETGDIYATSPGGTVSITGCYIDAFSDSTGSGVYSQSCNYTQ